MIVTVAGVMGVGKTTLVRLLAEEMSRSSGESWRAIEEPVDQNPYLRLSYQDQKRWSFTHQVQYLIKRYELHCEAQLPAEHTLLDRSIYEGKEVFVPARHGMGWMTDDEVRTFNELSKILIENLRRPDLLILLDRPMEQVRQLIETRGRDFEKNVPDGFLASMKRHYDLWFERYDLGPKIRVDASQLDFTNRPRDLLPLTRKILSILAGVGAGVGAGAEEEKGARPLASTG